MKIQATRKVPVKLTIRSNTDKNYPNYLYVLVAPSGKIVGQLIEICLGIYRPSMIDQSYKVDKATFSAKDFISKEQSDA